MEPTPGRRPSYKYKRKKRHCQKNSSPLPSCNRSALHLSAFSQKTSSASYQLYPVCSNFFPKRSPIPKGVGDFLANPTCVYPHYRFRQSLQTAICHRTPALESLLGEFLAVFGKKLLISLSSHDGRGIIHWTYLGDLTSQPCLKTLSENAFLHANKKTSTCGSHFRDRPDVEKFYRPDRRRKAVGGDSRGHLQRAEREWPSVCGRRW